MLEFDGMGILLVLLVRVILRECLRRCLGVVREFYGGLFFLFFFIKLRLDGCVRRFLIFCCNVVRVVFGVFIFCFSNVFELRI